jgi:protein XagA
MTDLENVIAKLGNQGLKQSLILKLGFLFCLLLPHTSFAGAWAQKENEGLALGTYRFYSTDQEFESNGHVRDFQNNGEFRKHEWNFYLEYGITSKLTAVGNFFLQELEFENNTNGLDSNLGFPNQELGLRYQFASLPAQSVQILVSFPGTYSETTTPLLGNNQVDIEPFYFVGNGFEMSGRHGFWELGFGPKFRMQAPSDQLRWLATLGMSWSKSWETILQFEGTHGIGNDQRQTVGNNITVTTDYTLIKATGSLMYHIDNHWTVSAGPTFHVYGENTGAGGGGQISVGRKF